MVLVPNCCLRKVEAQFVGSLNESGKRQGLTSCCASGISVITAEMVKMGLLWLVHDIVVHLCQGGRADAVAAVTVGLLQLGEMDTIIQINNSLISSGHGTDAVKITGQHLINPRVISIAYTFVYHIGICSFPARQIDLHHCLIIQAMCMHHLFFKAALPCK